MWNGKFKLSSLRNIFGEQTTENAYAMMACEWGFFVCLFICFYVKVNGRKDESLKCNRFLFFIFFPFLGGWGGGSKFKHKTCHRKHKTTKPQKNKFTLYIKPHPKSTNQSGNRFTIKLINTRRQYTKQWVVILIPYKTKWKGSTTNASKKNSYITHTMHMNGTWEQKSCLWKRELMPSRALSKQNVPQQLYVRSENPYTASNTKEHIQHRKQPNT